jgi:hypothetical protein
LFARWDQRDDISSSLDYDTNLLLIPEFLGNTFSNLYPNLVRQKQQQWQIALFTSFTLRYNDNVGSSACWKSISLTSPKMNLITADVAPLVA